MLLSRQCCVADESRIDPADRPARSQRSALELWKRVCNRVSYNSPVFR
jgi:hypothetical protein